MLENKFTKKFYKKGKNQKFSDQNFNQNEMELTQDIQEESVDKILKQLTQCKRISDSKAKQFLLKLKSLFTSKKVKNEKSLTLALNIIAQIQEKTFNLSSRIITEVWKLVLLIQFNLFGKDEEPQVSQINSLKIGFSLQQLYQKVSTGKFNKIVPLTGSIQKSQILLQIWSKSFRHTDLKSLQYAILSLYVGWGYFFRQNSVKKQNIDSSSIVYLEKSCMYLVKYCQRIKQSQTFESMICLIKNVQQKFFRTFQNEISTALTELKKTFKLTQTINFNNIYLNAWEKIILSQIVCFSKRTNKPQQIGEIIKLLQIFKQTLFVQRLINFCRNYRLNKKNTALPIIPAEQLEYTLFCTMVNLLINSKMMCLSLPQDLQEKTKTQVKRETQNLRTILIQFVQILTKRQISVMMTRQLIKRLQISNINCAVQQWKQVFSIMLLVLKSYPTNRAVIQFQNDSSYISKKFSPPIKFPFSIALKLKGQSIPFKQQKILIQFFDSQVRQKVWITMRNYEKNVMVISFVKFFKSDILAKEQKQFAWNQYQQNTIEIVIKSNKFRLTVNNDDSTLLCIENTLKKVDQMVLCDRQSGMGSTISQLFHFKLIQYNIFEDDQKNQVDLALFIDQRHYNSSKDLIKQNIKFFKCHKIQQHSFIHYVQSLGDMELFILILSHTLKKIKRQNDLLEMIRSVLSLMEEFNTVKDVQNKQLTNDQKDLRRKSILCLCWFFAKQTKSVFIILELMRFIYIRGKRDNQQLLKFLCNFSYWRQFKLESQIVLMMKIKQLLKESSRQDQKIGNLTFCKKLLFDMVLYFKETHFISAEKETCLKLHKIIFQTIYEQIRDILQTPNRKNRSFMLQIFLFLEFLINLVSCILNRKISEQAFDVTFAIELTLLLRDLSKLVFVSKQRKNISKIDIDLALEIYFYKDEKQLILPLSLNVQQAHEQRFSLFLTKIMSDSKSLITLFQTETFYIEQSQTKIYPIYSEVPIACSQSKVNSNIVSFNIYLSMLSDKSWSYILFGMPIQQYTQRYCENIWRICFYELFKQKKYFSKMCKMLEQTPLPQNEYCLMKIFEAVLFYSIFQKEHLYRILKSDTYIKSICPFKLEHTLLKYFNKLQPEVVDNLSERKPTQSSFSSRQQKLYYVLFHNKNSNFFTSKQLIECLKYRQSYQNYKIILYHLVLKSLVDLTQQKNRQKNQLSKTTQSAITSNEQMKRGSQTSIQISSDILSSSQKSNFSVFYNMQTDKNLNKQTSQDDKLLIQTGIQTLKFYLDSFSSENMKQFSNFQAKQDIEALTLNFKINVEGMLRALSNSQTSKSLEQFKKYTSFIQVFLKKYSQNLIFLKFPSFRPLYPDKNVDQVSKKSRNKFLYKTVHVDLIKHSTDFFVEMMKERRFELHTLQRIWSQVQEKNKYFWNLFINSQKYYSLSDITTESGERLLLTITNDKPKVQLPRMINKHSVLNSVSLISDKHEFHDQSQSSTLFQDTDFFKTQLEQNEVKDKQKTRKGSASYTKQIKTKKFRVLLINNDKIYQGLLFMAQKHLIKFQQTYTSQKLYDKICANPQQRRDDDDIERQPRCFDIIIGGNSIFYMRKYLFFDAGLEIFSHEKHHFFCFDSNMKRDKFHSLYLKQHRVITYEKAKKLVLQDSIKWSKGMLSNFQYLMKVNQYANRSPNDISQYYIMPWTIIQFENKQIDKTYIFQEKNFRDLKKPLGMIFQKKWKEIQQRFKTSFGHSKSAVQGNFGIQPFLYGSFYSNPAIVTNYMIRLQPFSSLHYHLQSQKIDVADRLFFQFSDQFRSIQTNISDIRELIPEFYSNAQLLKNRGKLNLGSRQNKEIVNDVRLPKWADSASEFVFKMKYFLQCPLVSKYLNYWIDLIFGIKAKRQNALTYDNLFMSEIYGPKQSLAQKDKDKRESKKAHSESRNSSILDFQNRINFNKQFGQLPSIVFDNQHAQFQMNQQYYFFRCTWENLYTIAECSYQNASQIFLSQNIALVSSSRTFDLFQTGSNDHSQKQNWKTFSSLCINQQISNGTIVLGPRLGCLSPYLFYIKKDARKLYSRTIKKAKIFGSLQLGDQIEIMDAQIFNWIDGKILIVGCNNTLKIYSFQDCSISQSLGKVHLIKLQESKPALSAKQFPAFTQHRAQIQFIQTNEELKLIVSLDQMNKLFLLKYFPDKIQVINNFQIKNCHFEQKIIKVLVHKMSLILCLTSYNRLLTYSFYGDFIGSKQIGFKSQAGKKLQKVSCISFFNKQTCQLLIGTNLGNIWKVDLFEFYKTEQEIEYKELWFEKITLSTKENEYEIKDIKVKRYGRHWQIYTISYDQLKRKVVSKARCLSLKNITFNLYK